MERGETLATLRNAHDEMIQLRRRIVELEPKAHAYDTLAATVRLNVREEGGYASVDAAWRLKLAIDELVAEREVERQQAEVAVE